MNCCASGDTRLKSIRSREAPKSLIVEKVKAGVDGLITTLRDPIDAEVFEAGKGRLKVVAQIAVGFDNINRADCQFSAKIRSPVTADASTEATAEFAFFLTGNSGAEEVACGASDARAPVGYYWHPPICRSGETKSLARRWR